VDGPRTLARAPALGGGELTLRQHGPHLEIISNGVFLMDTRDGRSERLLGRAALDHLTPPAHLLIGGLGVGYTLAEAATHPAATTITVAEREPAVIAWHATHLRAHSAAALDDPRVHLRATDLLHLLRTDPTRYDAICLDIDNGPDWTVTDGNADLYRPAGLDLLTTRLTTRGVLAVWSAGPAPAFEQRLRARHRHVTVHTVPVPRGDPDHIYLARP
jgi:spermidine synthase